MVGTLRARKAITDAFDAVEAHLVTGGVVVIPADDLGTGLAELPRRAARIYTYIEARIAALSIEDPAQGSGNVRF